MAISVYNKQQQKIYTLDNSKEIARGGEGYLVIVPTNPKLVAKIYLPNCVNITENKFAYLNKLDDRYFVKPQELLYDKTGKNIIGITMEYLPSNIYPLDVIFNKSYCLKHNIDFKIKEKITNTLIEAVKSAHSLSIDIGDLSGLNIMITDQGDVKFIDVDSYQVPGIKHSNKLLEDIRDYLYGGTVCVNSDYYSLSVIIFNFLTYLHPFKGVHKKIGKLSERIINKKPVFSNDPDLIIPKCYEKLQDPFLIQQYEKLYLKGERFLISINKFAAPVTGKIVPKQLISEREVTIQYILDGSTIEYSFFNNHYGIIRTKEYFIIYDVSNKGMFFKRSSFKRTEWREIFIGEKNIIGVKGDSIFQLNILNGLAEEIQNFKVKSGQRCIQLDNFLVLIEDEFRWTVNIDEINYKNIQIEKTNVYGPGFKTYNGIVQNVGGVNYIYANIRNKINIYRSPILIRGYFSINDVGVIRYEENKSIKYKFYNLKDGQVNLTNNECDEIHNFAYKGSSLQDALLFVPEDNKIVVVRALDFYRLAEIECSVISKDTVLFNTTAGIVAVNENESYLINKK